MQLSQVRLEVDELIRYLQANLKVQIKDRDGSIDYLSLAHDYQVFNQANKSRVTQSLSERSEILSGGSKSGSRAASASGKRGVARQSTEAFHPPNMRVEPQLEQRI